MEKCITKPTIIGKRMTFPMWLILFFLPHTGYDYDKAKELAKLNVNNYYLRALYTQAYHETGGFTSNVYLNSYNMFGMGAPNSRKKYCNIYHGYAAYKSFKDGIDDRIGWDNQKRDFKAPQKESEIPDYFAYLSGHGYAEDKLYTQKLERLYFDFKNKHYFSEFDEGFLLDSIDLDELNNSISNDYEEDLNLSSSHKSGKLKLLIIPVALFLGYKLLRKLKR
jgi:hypothetical protein